MKLPVEILFASEQITPDLLAEMLPLMTNHWTEVAHFKDIPLNPDFTFYTTVANAGQLRVYTLRDQSVLKGYAIFGVRYNPHYATSKQATQDILYLDPALRGSLSIQFIRYCNKMLASEGVQAVYHHVKIAKNFGPVLKRLGFEHVEEIYVKRLDLES